MNRVGQDDLYHSKEICTLLFPGGANFLAERISSVESGEDGDFPTAVTELSQNRSHCTGQNLLSETSSEAT